jgi:myo-inositol-1(or 4)-monophosphatase
MTTIDPDVCAALLRTLTDRVAAIEERPGADQDLGSLIGWVKKTSHDAAEAMRIALAERYPDIGWVGEEEHPEAAHAVYWVHDPIDGAYHFLQGLPLWSSSLALVAGGRAVFALVYDPASGEMFTARDGLGAMVNGRSLAAAGKSDLGTAVLGTAIPPIAQVGRDEQARALALLGVVSPQVFVVRQMAATSLQLAYVAAGRLDGYWEIGQDMADWLAGALLVREAGGAVSDLAGETLTWTSGSILAAAPEMHAALLPVMEP